MFLRTDIDISIVCVVVYVESFETLTFENWCVQMYKSYAALMKR